MIGQSISPLKLTQFNSSLANQVCVASMVASVLPTKTVCLMPLLFVDTVEYISLNGKSVETSSSPLLQVVSSILFAQKNFFPSFAKMPVSVLLLPVTSLQEYLLRMLPCTFPAYPFLSNLYHYRSRMLFPLQWCIIGYRN